MTDCKEIATRLGVPVVAVEVGISFLGEAKFEEAVKTLREQGRIGTKYDYELQHYFGINTKEV